MIKTPERAYLCPTMAHCRRSAAAEFRSAYRRLTVSEARLAARFAETASLKVSAELLGLTEGTARVYMKRIFAKTGVNSQAALMKLVLAGLAAPRPFDAT